MHSKALHFLSVIAYFLSVLTCEANSNNASNIQPCSPPCGATECDGLFNGPAWIGFDYLMWWTRGMETPPLVTTSPDGTPFDQAGEIGNPATTELFGGHLDDQMRSGIRFRSGAWFDCEQTHGIEFQLFYLETKSDSFQETSNGGRILARPFIDANTGESIAELVSFPGVVNGTIDVSTPSGLWGWGINKRHLLAECCCHGVYERLDCIAGYRYLKLRDQVNIQESLSSPLFGIDILLNDQFATRTEFHGGEVGLSYQRRQDCWILDSYAKVALGVNNSDIHVDCNTTFIPPGQVNQGGLLALPSNIGDWERNKFSGLMDLGFQIGCRITDTLTLHSGYSFLYWPGVYRAGKQIDPVVNPNLLPPALPGGPARPAPRLTDNDFWAQGLHLGATFVF